MVGARPRARATKRSTEHAAMDHASDHLHTSRASHGPSASRPHHTVSTHTHLCARDTAAVADFIECKIVTENLCRLKAPCSNTRPHKTHAKQSLESTLPRKEKALDQSPPPQRMPSAPYAEGPPRPAPGASALRAGLRPDAGTERGCDMARRSAASAAWRRACASRIGSEE